MNAKRIYWMFCSGFFAAAVGALASTSFFDYTINATTSLPGTFYVIHKGAQVRKGDLVGYRWSGGATYPAGTTFIKRVIGVQGDEVKVKGDGIWVNDLYIGKAKPYSKAGVPLSPVSGGVIRDGEYFVATPSPDSLDSRYSLSGNVKESQLIGRAYEIF